MHEKPKSPAPSFKNRIWRDTLRSHEEIQALISAGADPNLATVLHAKSVAATDFLDFMDPFICNLLPDPAIFENMDPAANKLFVAIFKNQNISIWADCSIDGILSAAALKRFLDDYNHQNHEIHIQNAKENPVFLNADDVITAQDNQPTLNIVMGYGPDAYDAIKHLHQENSNPIFIDCYQISDKLPNSLIHVNSTRHSQPSEFYALNTTTLSYLLLIATNLRLQKFIHHNKNSGTPRSIPDMISYLDLVALSSICCELPATALNNAIIKRGLEYLQSDKTHYISAIQNTAKLRNPMSYDDYLEQIGPRITSGARLGKPSLSIELISTPSRQKAKELAKEIELAHSEQFHLLQSSLRHASEALSGRFQEAISSGPAICVVQADNEIVKLTAKVLTQKLKTPSLVLSADKDHLFSGTIQSLPGLDIGEVMKEAQKLEILQRHKSSLISAEISLEAEAIPNLDVLITDAISKQPFPTQNLQNNIDAELTIDMITIELVEQLRCISELTSKTLSPKILINGVLLNSIRVPNEKTIRCVFKDPLKDNDTANIEVILTNENDTEFGETLIKAKGSILDILGTLHISEWRGQKRIQMILDDIRHHQNETMTNGPLHTHTTN